MSVSTCPLKDARVQQQLQSSPHRSSFLRVQSAGSLNAKHFVPPHSSSTPYTDYRKLSPTIVDSFSLVHPNNNIPKTSQLSFQSSTVVTPTDPVSENSSNSAYHNMEYSTMPASFNATLPSSYMTREHVHDLKTTPSLPYHDTRPEGEYLRVDFNPIVESLNFAATGSSYEALPNSSFGVWPITETMDVDSEMKSRLDFRTQLLGQGNSISRLADDFRTAEQLYSTTNNRRNPNAFAGTSSRPCELNHFSLISTQRDHGPNCLPHFDVNGYPNVDGRNPQADKTNISSGLVNEMSPTVTGTNRMNSSTMMPPRSSNQCPPASTQALAVSANDNSMVSSVMMTPDSSTTGFVTNKFTGSSDDGEVSPTPTNSSGRPHTPGRMRKAAPTLATGRRNLKGELVDPDEADRRMKRRERNRKSAQKCRERKVQRTQELQAQVECLQLEINRLTQERDSLRTEARQFVTLLQLHCPGVAIPYMSCLNDTLDSPGNSNESLQPSSIKATNGFENNATNGWKTKQNGKLLPEIPQVITPASNNPFSTLPTMVSLHSHMSPARSKSLFTFNSHPTDRHEANGRLSTTSAMNQLVSSLGYRTNSTGLTSTTGTRCTSTASVRGPHSSSSSSSCSAYELSFTNLETPVRTPALSVPFEELPNHAREAVICPSTNHSGTYTMAQTSVSTSTCTTATIGLETTRIKCEEWDPRLMEPHTKSHNQDKVNSISPTSQCTQTKHGFSSSAIDANRTTGRCDLRREESMTPGRPGGESVCY